jgi:formylglycine-generating enzyme required for sulfatase activity/alpha-tubulin suppressor-like RCC1 family protein
MLSSAALLLAQVPALTEPLKISQQTWGNVPTTVISGVLKGAGSISYEWEGAASTLESGIAVATNDWKTAAAGAGHVIAIKADGSLWGWGDNSSGQLGIALQGGSFRASPVLISAVNSQTPVQWAQVFAFDSKSGGIKSDGSLWLWGKDIGSEPVQVGGERVWESGAMDNTSVVVISRSGELCRLKWGSIASYKLYGLSAVTDELVEIDVKSGAMTPVFKLPFDVNISTGFDYNPSDRQLYATAARFGGVDLYKISVDDKTALLVKTMTTGDGSLEALGFTNSGDIYGYDERVSFDTGTLYRIKRDTSDIEIIGSSGTPSVLGGDYDTSRNVFWVTDEWNGKVYQLSVTNSAVLWTSSSTWYAGNGAGDLFDMDITPSGEILVGGSDHGSGVFRILKLDPVTGVWEVWLTLNGGIDDYRIASVPSATSGVAFENLQSIGGDAAWAAVAVRGDDVFAIKRDRSLWRVQLSGGGGLQKVGGNQRWKSIDIGDGYCVALREDGTLWAAQLEGSNGSDFSADLVKVDGGMLPETSQLGAVPVDTFYIGKTEVTWGEWQTVRTWAVEHGYTDLAGVGQGVGDNYPVTDVNWYDVVKWCNARSEKEGRTPVYQLGGGVYKIGQSEVTVNASSNGYRLPSHAEWEFAARGGTQAHGYTYSGSHDFDAVGWYDGNSGFVVHEVGKKQANELGISDMSGNVWEWSGFEQIRGGAWNYSAEPISRLNGYAADRRNHYGQDFGFRVALNAPTNGVAVASSGPGTWLGPVFTSSTRGTTLEPLFIQLGASSAWVHAAAGVAPLAVDASGKTFWVSEYVTRAVDGPKVACAKVFAPKINFSSAETYSESGLALGRDSTLWAWGDNSSGQLGNFALSGSAGGYTQDSAQVGVSPLWNLLSPVQGIPVAYSNPTASFAKDVYSLKVGGQRVGRIAQNNWSTTEEVTSMIRPISSGSLTFAESPMNLGAGSSTSYRWLRNGTFHSVGSSITTNAPGIYWAESFTQLESRTAAGASGSNRLTLPSISNLFIGMAVEGTGIPAGTVITGFVGTGTVTLSGSLTSAIASTTTLKFGIVSKGEPKIIPNSDKVLKDIYSYLSTAASDFRWEYQTLSSGSLTAGTSAAAAGSVKATASLLKAAVDLLLLAADSTQEVKLDLVQGGTTATFRQLIGPSPKSTKLTAIGTSFQVGDEITPTYNANGSPNIPFGTKVVAISGTSVISGGTVRLSNPALITAGSSTVWISSSPARKVLRSLGFSGGLDPRPGSVAADQDNSVLPKVIDTSLVKKWLMDLNPSLADKSLLGQLKNADTLLASITDPAFFAVLPQSIFVGSNFTNDIVVDYGDVLFLRAWVKSAMAALRWFDLQNTDVDIMALRNMISTGALSLQAIWEKYPLLGGAGAGKALDFETDLKAALTLYQQYSKFTNPRFGERGAARMIPGKLCLSSLEPEDVVQLRDIIDKTLDSINAASATAGVRTFTLGNAESLTLSPNAFVKRAPSRADFPTFVGNAYVPGSLKTDFAYSVYPDLKTSDIAGAERWLIGLEATLNASWKTGSASPLNLTIGSLSTSSGGWITATGTITGAAPVGSVLVTAGSAASGTFSATAIVTERVRASLSDPRIYDWSVQMPAPISAGSAKLSVSVTSALGMTSAKPIERMVPVTTGSLPAITAAGSIAFAVTPGQPASLATVFLGAGALSYEWVKNGTLLSATNGVIAAVDDWASVSLGQSRTAAIKRDGSLWAWGSGKGISGEPIFAFPKRIGTSQDWVSVACSSQNIHALKRDGTVWREQGDQSGNFMTQLPFMSQMPAVPCIAIFADNSEAPGNLLAILRDGSLWQYADGYAFTAVGYDSDWISAAAGPANFAIKKDGSLWGWSPDGAGESELLSAVYARDKTSPSQIGWDQDWLEVKVASSNADGSSYAIALKKDGSLWSLGRPPWRSLEPVIGELPVRVGPPAMAWSDFHPGSTLLAQSVNGLVYEFYSDGLQPAVVPLPGPALNGSVGPNNRAIITQDGVLWMWGSNASGQLGNYTVGNYGIAGTEYPSADAWYSTPVQAGVNSVWGLASPVRGIPVPLSFENVGEDDFGSYQVRVSRGSDAFSWRTFAGAEEAGNSDGVRNAARFSSPSGLAVFAGTLFVSDAGNNSIRSVRFSSGGVTTLSFTGATLEAPGAIAVSNGSLYIVDGTTIRRAILRSGALTTLLGAGTLSQPSSIAVDPTGVVYVADRDGTIRRIAVGSSAAVVIAGSSGDEEHVDGSGVVARFRYPNGLSLFAGTLFVVDPGVGGIRKIALPSSGAVTPDRVTVSTVAGRLPSMEDDGRYFVDAVGADARLGEVWGLAIDSSGTLYFSDTGRVRRMTPDCRVTTLGGMDDAESLGAHAGVAVDGGTIYIADPFRNQIRAGTPPSVQIQRATATVALINLDLREMALAPISVSGTSRLTLSGGSNTPQPGVTYQWIRNGAALNGATSMNATVSSPVSGWYSMVARAGSCSVSSPPIPVSVDNANVTRARAAMAQGNFAMASGTLSASSTDGTELILRSVMDVYGFLNEPATKVAMGTLGMTMSGTLANGWIDPWLMSFEGGLERLVSAAPTAAVRAVLTGSTANALFAKLEASDAKLAKITDKNFVSVLSPADFGKPIEGGSNIVIDYGDVQFVRALLHAGMAAIKWVEMQNTDVDLFSLLFSSQNGRLSLESLLTRYPSLFAASSTGSTAQTAFESRIKDALKYYQAFSDFVNPSAGKPARMSPDDCVVKIETPEELAEERLFRSSVNKALESINATSEAVARRTFDLGNGRSVTLSPRAFVKHAAGWRADLPRFQKNRYVSNSLNLAMLRSMYPSLNYGEVAKMETSKFLSESFWNELLGTREDDAAPTLALDPSLASGLKTTDGSVELGGVVSDASGVERVRLTLDSNGETYDAVLEELAPSSTGLRQYNWSLIVPLPTALSGGSVKFTLTAEDVFGGKMEAPLARSALVLQMVRVSYAVQGRGRITLNPAPDAEGLLRAGTSVLVTATSEQGSLLRRIESVVDGEAQPNQTVKTATGGTLRINVSAPTDLLAVFEVNPYPLLGGRKKMLGGLLSGPRSFSSMSTPMQAVQISVTDTGSFSGRLFVGRTASTFTGSFDEDGVGVINASASQAFPQFVFLGSYLVSRNINGAVTLARPPTPYLSRAGIRIWIDASDEANPVLYASGNSAPIQMSPFAAMDYSGPPAFTGVFGTGASIGTPYLTYNSLAYDSGPGLGDGSPKQGGFVSIMPRRTGAYTLAGVLPSGERITASGFLLDQFKGVSDFAGQTQQSGEYSKIETLIPTGTYGSTALEMTLFVPENASKARAGLGWARRENWLSLMRGPKFATGQNVSQYAFAAEWTVGALGFVPAKTGQVLRPFARNGAPISSEVFGLRLGSNTAFSVMADTRNRMLVSGSPSNGFTNPSVSLNHLTGVFTGRVSELSKPLQLQGVLLQGELPAGTRYGVWAPAGAGYASDGRMVAIGGMDAPWDVVPVSSGVLPSSSPLGPVAVNAFYIGKHEVTWGEWQRVRDWAGWNGYSDLAWGQGSGDNYPVTQVNWFDVVKWCNARSEMEGKTPVYMNGTAVYRTGSGFIPQVISSANGYRLPSEAEWEFAARGGTQTQGYTYSGSNDLDAVGWYDLNSGGAVHEVGKKLPNELGIYDMSGNWKEWTGSRVMRGGGVDSGAEFCTVSYRNDSQLNYDYPNNNGYNGFHVGFRVALSLVP